MFKLTSTMRKVTELILENIYQKKKGKKTINLKKETQNTPEVKFK